MTSIPANVQNYLGGNQTERPRVQATEAKEDFGKVLDRQKPEPIKDSGPKTGEPKKDVTGTEDAKVPEQTEGEQAETGKIAGSQEQETETANISRQPEGDAGEKVTEPEQLTAETDPIITGMPVTDRPVEELSAEELEEIMEVLQSAIQQIQNLLVQQLNLTPQELEQLMQDTGLTDADLLQPEVVNQLILDAVGAENSMALVMDESLYARQQIVTQEHQEITHDLEKQLGEQEGKLPKVLESLQKSMSSQPVQEPAAAESQSGNGRATEGKADSRQQNQNGAGQIIFQNYAAQVSGRTIGQADSMTAGMEAAYLDTQDSQQVMNQILDYMKVSMKPENTVLDMQLHPESLGTLHVQISAREGVMTAHFTASSEAVKTVLENQMTALKESFLQQDIKVDAIEVTVETHQFESNLEQGRQRGGETEERRPKRRRLDINSLESGEELTEAEQIITDMMTANGNSVDYLA